MILFGISYKLVIGTKDFSALDLSFKVKKTLKPTPNTCQIEIYNLAKESRKYLSEKKAYPVQLEAGYQGENSVLYLGELRNATHREDGEDWVSLLETGDADQQIQTSRINIPVGKGTPVDTVFERVIAALGVKPGNFSAVRKVIKDRTTTNFYGSGSVVSGNAAQELTALCRSAGLEWSVQDGAIQILDLTDPTSERAIILRPDTGLLGSPLVDHKGVLSCSTLMIPGLVPGRKVSVETEDITGGFRIEEVEYTGNTTGSDWGCTVHAKRY